MDCNYIKEKEFLDFKKNLDRLITIFNHNISSIGDDVKVIREKVNGQSTTVSEMKGSLKITNRLVWWIFGIIAFLLGSIIINMINGGSV